MTQHILLQGEVGDIEVLVDQPLHQPIRGIALITHPHPLMGGGPKHKIPQLLSDILAAQGYLVWRPYFRGVGQSAGVHDDGIGESQDIAHLAKLLQQQHPDVPFVAGGFSFGAHVWVKSWHLLAEDLRPQKLVLAGLPCGRVRGSVDYQTPTIDGEIKLIHGEADEICALADVIAWAKPQKHPITIMPGANHFFTGYLKPLAQLISDYFHH